MIWCGLPFELSILMSNQPVSRQIPKSAQPFNRRMRSQGAALPPAGTMRRESRAHFVTQERIGVGFVLLFFYAIGYGWTRELLTPLYWIGGVALVMAFWPARRRRRRASRRSASTDLAD